jgi:hypothetical protein
VSKSKAGTGALAAAVTVNQCIYMDKDWLNYVREKSACREDFAEVVSAARSAELAENAGAGRVCVVMGEPKAVRNAHEARVLGKDMLLWRARDETRKRKEILPEDMAAPTERTAEDLNKIVGSWLQYGELGIIAKRQTAFNFAYDKRARTGVEHPWMVTMAMSDAKVDGRPGSFGKKVGQMVLGFEKRDAPLHLQRRIQKPPSTGPQGRGNPLGEKNSGSSFRASEADTARDPNSLTIPRGPTLPPPAGQATTRPAVAAGRTGVAPGGTTAAAGRQGSSGGDNGGGRSSTGSARAVMEPAPKKAKVQNEEDTFREMLVKATDRYRGNPSGIAAMTERAIVAMGVHPDRSEVLAVTAKILAYHYHKQGK